MSANFDYHAYDQIAEVTCADGLALIQRDSTCYVNEPSITGGNPILADGRVLFNDMLGTTLGVKEGNQVTANSLTAFGEPLSASPMEDSFFTGKPHVGEMGYVFLFRAYRADQGKWQTADPLGYPDGWNNTQYCGNALTSAVDLFGAWKFIVTGNSNPSHFIEDGTTTKKPNGEIVYFDYIAVTASQRASGSGTDTLTINSSGIFLYRDTNSNIDLSIAINFTSIYTIDGDGKVSMRVIGNTTKDNGNLSISASPGANLTVVGQYSEISNGTITNHIGRASVGIKFKIVE